MHNPRQIIDVDAKVIQSEEDPKAKELRKFKQLLIHVEKVRSSFEIIWDFFRFHNTLYYVLTLKKIFVSILQTYDILLAIDELEKKALALPDDAR